MTYSILNVEIIEAAKTISPPEHLEEVLMGVDAAYSSCEASNRFSACAAELWIEMSKEQQQALCRRLKNKTNPEFSCFSENDYFSGIELLSDASALELLVEGVLMLGATTSEDVMALLSRCDKEKNQRGVRIAISAIKKWRSKDEGVDQLGNMLLTAFEVLNEAQNRQMLASTLRVVYPRMSAMEIFGFDLDFDLDHDLDLVGDLLKQRLRENPRSTLLSKYLKETMGLLSNAQIDSLQANSKAFGV